MSRFGTIDQYMKADEAEALMRGANCEVGIYIDGLGIVDLRDRRTLAALPHLLQAQERMARKVAAKIVTDHEIAGCIKVLRTGDGGMSWRELAKRMHEIAGGGWSPPNHQIIGVELCRIAARVLGENHMDTPWN